MAKGEVVMTRSSPATETLLPCPLGCEGYPQHMYREICRDMQSPNWNKPQSRIWCPCCGLSMVKEGIEEVRTAWNTRAFLQPATPTSCPYKGPFGCKCESGECKYRAGGDAVAGEAKALADALEALPLHDERHVVILEKAAAALRSPDEAATPSEPVAWREETFGPGKGWYYSEQYWTGAQPLYAAPQPANAAQPSWQPIETAPKMKVILLFAVTDVDDDGRVRNWKMATGSWHTGWEGDETQTAWFWDGYQVPKYATKPTHWMPLPEAPSLPSTHPRPLCSKCGLEDGACICAHLAHSSPQLGTASTTAGEVQIKQAALTITKPWSMAEALKEGK
jgi:hypothetical protein